MKRSPILRGSALLGAMTWRIVILWDVLPIPFLLGYNPQLTNRDSETQIRCPRPYWISDRLRKCTWTTNSCCTPWYLLPCFFKAKSKLFSLSFQVLQNLTFPYISIFSFLHSLLSEYFFLTTPVNTFALLASMIRTFSPSPSHLPDSLLYLLAWPLLPSHPNL